MFKALYSHALQHLVAQNSWASAILKPYAGQSVRFDFKIFPASLVILEEGSLVMAGESNTPDATIIIPPSLLLRLSAGDDAARLQIKIEGDSHLATALAQVLTQMRWDYEDDLSKLVGDVPAHVVGEFARKTVHTAKKSTVNLAEMLGEYWQEESLTIAKKQQVQAFNDAVDVLRADVARLEKKIEKLKLHKADSIHSNQVSS